MFGECLRVENVLQNYDVFFSLKALQGIDMNDAAAVEAFKTQHYLNDESLVALQAIKMPVGFAFAEAEQQREAQELISCENLNAEAARRYITTSLKRELAVAAPIVIYPSTYSTINWAVVEPFQVWLLSRYASWALAGKGSER